jgi:hypothetical protein
MKIVINSHKNSGIALAHLLDSMRSQPEFNNYEVIVVIGGFYEHTTYETKKVDNNITYIECNYNSIDFTSFIALVELFSSNVDDYYFYMHDTCRVGDNFYKKLKEIDLNGVSSIKIYRYASMNIGVYSQRLLNQSNDFLMSKKHMSEVGIDDFKRYCISAEDYIFNNDPTNQILDNLSGCIGYIPPHDYYGTGIMRCSEHYPNIDLYKMKANWGGENADTVVLKN